MFNHYFLIFKCLKIDSRDNLHEIYEQCQKLMYRIHWRLNSYTKINHLLYIYIKHTYQEDEKLLTIINLQAI